MACVGSGFGCSWHSTCYCKSVLRVLRFSAVFMAFAPPRSACVGAARGRRTSYTRTARGCSCLSLGCPGGHERRHVGTPRARDGRRGSWPGRLYAWYGALRSYKVCCLCAHDIRRGVFNIMCSLIYSPPPLPLSPRSPLGLPPPPKQLGLPRSLSGYGTMARHARSTAASSWDFHDPYSGTG